MPTTIEGPHSRANEHSMQLEANLDDVSTSVSSSKRASDRFPSQSNKSELSNVHYLENAAFIAVGLIAGYCFHTIASRT
jgi:tetrahydromethanopterin S-methyltransferase subunit B